MTMAIALFERVGVTPATFSLDLAAEAQIDHRGPYKVSLYGACDTADALAGVLIFGMTHRTPTDNAFDAPSSIIFGSINLADGDNYFSTPQEVIVRQSASSLWEFTGTLAGIAGSSKASYWLIVEPIEATDYSAIGAGVSP